MRVGRISSTYFGNDEGIIKAEEAWNIDQKLDDGLADSGKLLATCGADFANLMAVPVACLGCTTAHWGTNIPSSYILNDSSKSCVMTVLLN